MQAVPLNPDEAIRVRLLTLVSSIYGIAMDEIVRVTRGSDKAVAARQLAIYLSHTALAMPLTDLASVYGRSKSTALHSVRKIEAMREDPKVDRTLSWLETALRGVEQ